MKKLLFFDTETTGLDQEDRLFQLAYKIDGQEYAELFKPPLTIHPQAAAITGVSDEDVADKPPFIGSQMCSDVQGLSLGEDVVFVAHNAKFDVEMMRREGIEITQVIDTYKIARALDTEDKVMSFKLESLCEHYGVDTEAFQAHDALGDVLMLELLYEKLAASISDKHEDPTAYFLGVMAKPLLVRKFPFGKYKGAALDHVAKQDGGYMEWLLGQKRADAAEGRVDEDWIYSLSYYLGKECEYGEPATVLEQEEESESDADLASDATDINQDDSDVELAEGDVMPPDKKQQDQSQQGSLF